MADRLGSWDYLNRGMDYKGAQVGTSDHTAASDWTDYLVYCEAKQEIEEEPLTLEQWRDFNNSPLWDRED